MNLDVNRNVNGKHIIITGASKGLGAVAAKTFASHGAKLVLLARSKELLEEVRHSCEHPDNHLCIAVDLAVQQDLEKAINKAVQFLTNVDVVLHCAGGGLGLRDPLLSWNDFNTLLTINVQAAAEINRMIIPLMKQQKQGYLVHVCSVTSTDAVGSVGYNSAKAALAAYVRTLGNLLAKDGIVATGILPGAFYGPKNVWRRKQAEDPALVQAITQERFPRGFIGDAEELMPLILLLCTPAASMMAGCCVPIDAGEGKGYVT
ncbi:SDR family oxidoreductase [Candidatus Woesearchaeota archaeon]|nr:SDR family oxidoreductase [Candidatus Woesearchaeota archaeon]